MAADATTQRCEHFEAIHATKARSRDCEACRALGADWTQLRVCLTCGEVGCCEDSPHAHALRHYETTGHPMIASLERGEHWGWCYPHLRYFDPMPGPLPRKPSLLRALLPRATRRP